MVSILRIQPITLARYYHSQKWLTGKSTLTKQEKKEIREHRKQSYHEYCMTPVEVIHEATKVDILTMIDHLADAGLDHLPAPSVKVQFDENKLFKLRSDEAILGFALPKSSMESQDSGIKEYWTNDIKFNY